MTKNCTTGTVPGGSDAAAVGGGTAVSAVAGAADCRGQRWEVGTGDQPEAEDLGRGGRESARMAL